MIAELWTLLGGRALAGRQLVLLALAFGALAVQVGLLAVAGWFIVAAGLAGLGLYLLRDMHSPSGLIRLLALSRVLLRYGENLLGHDLLFRQMAQLRGRLFQVVAHRPSSVLQALLVDQVLERIVGDVHWLEQTLPRMLWPALGAGLLLPLIALSLLLICPGLSALVLVLWLAWLGSLHAAAVSGRRSGELLQRLGARRRAWLAESVGALSLLKQYGQVTARQRRLRHLDRLEWRLEAARERAETAVDLGFSLLGALTLVMVVIVLGAGCSGTPVSGPFLAWSLLGMLALLETLRLHPAAWLEFFALRQRVSNLNEAVASDSLKRSHPALAPTAPGGQTQQTARSDWGQMHRGRYGSGPQEPVRGEQSLRVRDLRILAPGDGRSLVQASGFLVTPGRPLLVCGASGLGKSRLLATIAGFAVPDRGEIRLGSLAQAEADDRAWHEAVGYLPQETAMLDDTVATNLRLAKPDADDRELAAVIQALGLAGVVDPERGAIHALVGSEGAAISGGEARRLALARLLLAQPDCVLLDEPFTGLDSASRARVIDRLIPWLAGRAAVIALHEPEPRLAAIGEVFWIRAGRLVPAAELT